MTNESKTWQCGTLTYTKPALAILLFWLLWGDVCYTLMEAVTGPIMQLKFKSLGASNTEIGLILGTFPGIVYSILNPVISFKSDRFRSRWGRRVPFILFSLPFLVAGLVCLGFGQSFGFWLHGHVGSAKGVSANRVAMYTLGVLLVIFTFFNTFVTSTFWYLFNDVVPEHLIARFMSWFRTISSLSAAFYSFCIFKYSSSHSTEIFVGAALLYLVGFGLMCLNVKEGQYLPPAPYDKGETGVIAAVKTFAKGTLSFPHYWYLWLNTVIGAIGGAHVAFTIFFYQSIGLSLAQIGIIQGSVSITVSVLTLGSGWLADRFHPIRVVFSGVLMSLLIVTPANLSWLFWHPAPKVAFWVAIAITVGLSAPSQALSGMWDPPLLMRLFPRENYGQFCSTNGVWRAVGGICGGGLIGVFLDIMSHWVGKERVYLYLPVWGLMFSIPSLFFFVMLYRSWKRHGGDENYVPPMIESAIQVAANTSETIVLEGAGILP